MRTFTIVPSFEGNSAFFELPDIGFQGDNLSFAILFNLTELTEHWSDILPSMIVTDPKNNTFLATHTRWDAIRHIFTWFISETETRYDGVLKCQLKCVSSSDPETVVCMSQICQTRVYKSLEAASDPPEAFQSWLDALERLAAEVHADLEYTLENVENIDEMISGVSDDIETITNNINSKMSKPTNDGTLDQVLYNNGDGTTRWDDPITEEDVKDAVGEWMDENIPSGTTIALDPTLSIPNTAAEAAVTGNRLAGLQKNVEDYKVNPDLLVSYKQAVPGNTVEVYDAVSEAVKQMQIAIEPVQDLNGYTKPWAPGGGKNLCPVDTVDFQASTTWVNLSNQNASTVTNGTKVHLSAGTYYVGFTDASNINTFQMFDSAGNYLLNGTSGVITISSEQDTYIRFKASDTSVNTKFKIQVEAGSTKTEWEPYSNVCPISGFTECEVTQIRKNLVSGVDASGGVLGRIEGYNTSGSYKMNNIYTHLKAGKTYTISFNAKEGNETATGYIALYSLDDGVLSDRFATTPFCDDEGLLTLSSDYKRIRATFDVDKDINRIVIGYYRAGKYCLYDPNTLMIEEGSEATSYEPFVQTYTITFPDGQTVYGGTLTINRDGTGTLVVDRISHEMQTEYVTSAMVAKTGYYGAYYNLPNTYPESTNKTGDIICDELKSKNVYDIAEDGIYANGTRSFGLRVNENSVSDKKETKLDNVKQFIVEHNPHFVYKLATPTSIQLTVPQIQMLLGYNRLYANTGDILSLEYPVERHQLADQAEKERVHKVLDVEYGSVISEFDDGADNAPMAMKIKFEPKQDLHGYDRPWAGGIGKNKFSAEFISGKTIQENGNISDYDIRSATVDYISVNENTEYTLSYTENENCGVFYYRSDKTLIEYISWGASPRTFTTPANCAYIRVSYYTNVPPTNVQLELGSTASDYSPYSNICPITGLTGAEVTRTGKNLFKYNKTDATGAVSNYILLDNTLKFKNFGDAINSGNLVVYFYDENKNEQSYTRLTYNIPSGETYTIEPVSGTKYIRFTSYRTAANGGIDAYISAPFMVAEDVENYEPYNGSTYPITFPTQAGTVYGGTLTVNKDGTGELEVDSSLVDLGDLSWTYAETYSSRNVRWFSSTEISNMVKKPSSNDYVPEASCSCFKTISRTVLFTDIDMDSVITINSSGNIVIRYLQYADDKIGFKSAVQGQKLVYKLASPIIYNLSAPVIRSLFGTNRVWSNDGKIIHIEYSKDIKTVFDDHADSIDAISIRQTVENYEEENVFSISDGANGAPMALTVGIESVQNTHGLTPYPPGGGKNLFSLPAEASTRVTSDGRVVMSGTASGNVDAYTTTLEDVTLVAETAYTISLHGSKRFRLRAFLHNKATNSWISVGQLNTSFYATYTPSENIVVDGFLFRAVSGETYDVDAYYQLELGSTATDYAPYSNICPITGWTGAEVTRYGKNLLNNATNTANKIINDSGEIASNSGIQITDYIPVKSLTSYVLTGTKLNGLGGTDNVRVNYYDSSKTWKYRSGANATNLMAFTTNIDTAYIRLSYSTAASNEILNIGTQAMDYVPFNDCKNYSITFPTSAGTVYGGTLTVNKDGTGTLVVTHGGKKISDLAWSRSSSSGTFYSNEVPDFPPVNAVGNPGKSSAYVVYEESNNTFKTRDFGMEISNQGFGSTKCLLIRDSRFDNATDLVNAMGNEVVVYSLATPIIYNISAPVVKSLLGTNNILADTGKILSVDYTRDTTMAVNSKVDTAYYEWQMQQTLDNIDTKAIPMSSIAYDIIHDYEKRRSL